MSTIGLSRNSKKKKKVKKTDGACSSQLNIWIVPAQLFLNSKTFRLSRFNPILSARIRFESVAKRRNGSFGNRRAH